MTDFRQDELQVIQRTDGSLTILKGGLYLCEIMNSTRFNQLLAGRFFNYDLGLSSTTLRSIADLMDNCENRRKT